MIEGLQDPRNNYCGVFCLYTLYHLYNPHEDLGVHNMEREIETVAKVLDQIYSHDESTELKKYNKKSDKMRRFCDKFNIKGFYQMISNKRDFIWYQNK